LILEKLKYISKIITCRTTKQDWDTLYINVKDNPLTPIMNMNLKISNLTIEEKHNLAEHIYFISTNYPFANQFRTPEKFIKYLESEGYEIILKRHNDRKVTQQ